MNDITPQKSAAGHIVAIIPLVMRVLASEMRRTGHTLMPAHYATLTTLVQLESCNLQELAEHLAVSPPTMSNLVSGLVAKGWLQRERSQQDRRRVDVSLTPAGRELLIEMQQIAVSRMSDLLLDLPAEDCLRLVDGLQLLGDHFSNIDPEATLSSSPDKRSSSNH